MAQVRTSGLTPANLPCGVLAKTAWRGFLAAARVIRDEGIITGFADLPDLNALLQPFTGGSGSQAT